MLYGIDVSDDQGTIDFGQLNNDPHRQFVFAAKDPGDQQAQHFLNFIDGYEGTLLPMVDVEQDSLAGFTGGPSDVIAALAAFDSAVRGSLPQCKLPIIYFGYSFWSNYLSGNADFSGHPAWPAENNSNSSLDVAGTGWSSWTLWQYADNGRVAGIAGNVDLDRLISLSLILR